MRLATIFILSACLSPVALADVATNAESDGSGFPKPADLYRFDGTQLVRSTCPEGAGVRNRATCSMNPKHAPFNEIYAKMTPYFGSRLGEFEQRARDYLVNIIQIDTKLLEILNGSDEEPAPGTATLERQLGSKLDELGDADTRVVELSDQVKRLEDELQRRAGPDLQRQLADLRREHGAALEAQHDLESAVAALRKQIAELNVGIYDPEVLRNLWERRRDLVERRAGNLALAKESVALRALLDRVFLFIADEGYTWSQIYGEDSDMPDGTWAILRRLGDVFTNWQRDH